MSKKSQKQFGWRQVLGIIAFGLGTAGTMETAAIANPANNQGSVQIAQVGVRSRINGPTPLNVTPRTHISLPTRSRPRSYGRRYYYGDRGYNRSRSRRRHYRRYRNYDRREGYRSRGDRYEHRYRHRSRKPRGGLTIFF